MKRIDLLRMMFACGVFCACNTLLYPAFQQSIQMMDQAAVQSSIESIVGVLADVNGEETDDYSEDSEFLCSSSTALYSVFKVGLSSKKIVTQPRVVLDPVLERSTPPPESFC